MESFRREQNEILSTPEAITREETKFLDNIEGLDENSPLVEKLFKILTDNPAATGLVSGLSMFGVAASMNESGPVLAGIYLAAVGGIAELVKKLKDNK